MQTDIHSHILCGIDDGAYKPAITQKALADLSREGVSFLGLTPHYYPSHKPMSRFLAQREKAYEELLEMPEAKKFRFALGAEVYFTETLFNYDDLSPLCYEGTRLMLTELEYGELYTSTTRRRLTRLVEDYRITPVLAHIDRYSYLLRDPSILEELRDVGCLFQVNFLSFGSFFTRRRLLRLAKRNLIDFIGEDIHKVPLVEAQRERLLHKIGSDALLSRVDALAKKKIFLQ